MDRHLQHKLQQFSAAPPDGAWQKISNALDAGESVGQRLLEYEEMPPAAAWLKIEKSLDEAVPAKVVPFTNRFRKPLRYAAVASFLAVVLVTITLTVERTEAGALDPENTITVKTNAATTSPAMESDNLKNPSAEAVTNNQQEQQTATTNNSDVAEMEKQNPATITAANNRKTNKAGPIYSSLNKYVFFSDGDGRTRKVSKKLASYVNCKENDLQCKQRLKELRQRMAASAMTTDFTGVLDLLRQLQ